MAKWWKRDRDQVSAFIEGHLLVSGKGFFLRNAYYLYQQWCEKEEVEHPVRKLLFAAFLEERFERTPRVDAVRFGSGSIRTDLDPYPPLQQKEVKVREPKEPLTEEQLALREVRRRRRKEKLRREEILRIAQERKLL